MFKIPQQVWDSKVHGIPKSLLLLINLAASDDDIWVQRKPEAGRREGICQAEVKIKLERLSSNLLP